MILGTKAPMQKGKKAGPPHIGIDLRRNRDEPVREEFELRVPCPSKWLSWTPKADWTSPAASSAPSRPRARRRCSGASEPGRQGSAPNLWSRGSNLLQGGAGQGGLRTSASRQCGGSSSSSRTASGLAQISLRLLRPSSVQRSIAEADERDGHVEVRAGRRVPEPPQGVVDRLRPAPVPPPQLPAPEIEERDRHAGARRRAPRRPRDGFGRSREALPVERHADRRLERLPTIESACSRRRAMWADATTSRRPLSTPSHNSKRRLSRGPGRQFELFATVEAAGIEPASENSPARAATCVACRSFSRSGAG